MPFKPGQSGNPAGRPKVHRILRHLPLRIADEVKGIDLVASIAAFVGAPLQMRLQAGSILAMYQEPKLGERIGRDLQLPEADSVETATQNIAKIGAEAAADRLPPDLASKLISHQQAYIDACVSHETVVRLAAIEAAIERLPPPAEVLVEGGLPDLPGSSILMPPRVLSPPPRRPDKYRGAGRDEGEPP
jgi:hypothetical protein